MKEDEIEYPGGKKNAIIKFYSWLKTIQNVFRCKTIYLLPFVQNWRTWMNKFSGKYRESACWSVPFKHSFFHICLFACIQHSFNFSCAWQSYALWSFNNTKKIVHKQPKEKLYTFLLFVLRAGWLMRDSMDAEWKKFYFFNFYWIFFHSICWILQLKDLKIKDVEVAVLKTFHEHPTALN